MGPAGPFRRAANPLSRPRWGLLQGWTRPPARLDVIEQAPYLAEEGTGVV